MMSAFRRRWHRRCQQMRQKKRWMPRGASAPPNEKAAKTLWFQRLFGVLRTVSDGQMVPGEDSQYISKQMKSRSFLAFNEPYANKNANTSLFDVCRCYVERYPVPRMAP